jgi:pimeloyl-ACP methyl ester carboxylesterase
VVLVVHDIGGIVGIPWAAANPQRIRGMVITNTVVFEHFRWFTLARIWAGRGLIGRTAAAGVMSQIGWFGGRLFRRSFARISPELGPADLDRITTDFALDAKSKRATLRLFRRMVPSAYFAGMDAMVRALVTTVPVRVVWGGNDPYIPERYAATFAPAPIEFLEHVGHWVPLSVPDTVAAAVTALLPTRATAAAAPVSS